MNIHFIVTSIMTVQFTLLLVARAHCCCFHCNISSVPSFNIYLQFKLPSTWFANPHKLGCMQNFTHTITTNIQVHNESVKQETTLSNAIHLLLYNQILHTGLVHKYFIYIYSTLVFGYCSLEIRVIRMIIVTLFTVAFIETMSKTINRFSAENFPETHIRHY